MSFWHNGFVVCKVVAASASSFFYVVEEVFFSFSFSFYLNVYIIIYDRTAFDFQCVTDVFLVVFAIYSQRLECS